LPPKRKEVLFQGFERWGFDEKGWSKRTRQNYLYRARAADAWLEEQYQVSLPYAKEKQLRAYLFSTSPTARNRNHIRQALVGFFAYLIFLEVAESNVAQALPVLPEPRSIPLAMEADVVARLLQGAKACGLRDEAIISTFAYEGMRKSEVRLLTWPQLDEEAGWIRFWGKGSKERKLPVHPELATILAKWRRKCGDPKWVFPGGNQGANGGTNGRPISDTSLARIVREVGELVGIPDIHPHLFRHSFATELLEGSGDLRTVQEALGHSSLSTTAGYLKVRPAKLEKVVGSLSYRRRSSPGTADAPPEPTPQEPQQSAGM
jgi:integrase